MGCLKNKCERCERYNKKCREYKKSFLKQETKNDELIEMIESIIETQNELLRYIDYLKNKKVAGVNIKKKTT